MTDKQDEPDFWLRQTSSDRNPPHGWVVHYIKKDGDVPVYLKAQVPPPSVQDDEVLEVLRRIVDVWGSPWPSGADPMQDVIRDACTLLEKRGAA